MDAKTVAVGLLNDTLDVTSSRAVDLREKFSEEIVDLVQDVSPSASRVQASSRVW